VIERPAASSTACSAASFSEVGMSTSMRQPDRRARVSRIVSAKIDAPPSAGRRSTDVMTT
jgi:hypothetical protein